MSKTRTWESNVPEFTHLLCYDISSETSKNLASLSSSYVVVHKKKIK